MKSPHITAMAECARALDAKERCPTCGRRVPTVFEHVDMDCASWPDRSEDTPENLLREAEAFIAGFEGDEMQKGGNCDVDALLARIRSALPEVLR